MQLFTLKTMTELVILDEADSLEEGEILDDCEVEVIDDIKFKEKKLPRRYTLHSNKSNSKHKKNCKPISHYQLEERNRPYKVNGSHKRHKSSCKHRTVGHNSFSGSQNSTGNSSTLEFNRKSNQYEPSFPIIKSAFKNFESPPRPAVKEKRTNPSNCQEIVIKDNYPQLLKEYKKVRHQKQNVVKLNNGDCRSVHSGKSEAKPSPKEVKVNATGSNGILQEPSLSETEDESEVEELRKIALATVEQKQADQKHQEGINSPIHLNNGDSSQPPFNLSAETFDDCGSRPLDNYDIVDMEIDSESVAESVDDLYNSNDLFVIDKNPAISSEELIINQYIQNHIGDGLSSTNKELPLDNERYSPSNPSQSKDEFEINLLRAELIANMKLECQKLKTVPQHVIPVLKPPECPNNDLNSLPKLPTVQKTSTHFRSILNSTNRIIKRAVKTKMNFSKLPITKRITVPPPRSITAGQERLIITLNNDDTTTDESEDEESDKKPDRQENVAVASIEALISDARQKSDINKVNPDDTNTVSCLSKAQQEEYNSLKRILAEKEPFQVPSPPPAKDKEGLKDKNVTHKLNMQISLKKIAVAKENLVKELEAMNNVAKELQTKKQIYMTSKLKAQHLKEQLHAAEVIRASHLDSWKKCSAKLDILKKSVLKRDTIIKQLETHLGNQSL